MDEQVVSDEIMKNIIHIIEMSDYIQKKYISREKVEKAINLLEMEEHYDYLDNKKIIKNLKELLGE